MVDDRVKAHVCPMCGRKRHNRLTVEQVLAIRALRERGLTLGQIAMRFGCTKVTVFHITTGKTWREIA